MRRAGDRSLSSLISPPGPGTQQTAQLARLVTMLGAWSRGGSCPRQARLSNISAEPFLSHSPLPKAHTPLSPTGSWPLTVLICDFIFPEWGELLRAGLLANWSGPIFLLPGPFAPLQEGSRWVCLPSLHLALHPRLRGACRTGAGHAGQPASSKAFIAVIWESRLPTLFPCLSVRETKHLERLKTFKRRKSKHVA